MVKPTVSSLKIFRRGLLLSMALLLVAQSNWSSTRSGACAFGVNEYDSGKVKVEQVGENAENLKEGSESWAEWVKEKLSEGLRLKTNNEATETAKQASHEDEASDAAKQTKDKVQDVASGEGGQLSAQEEAKEKLEAAKEKAYQKIEEAKEKTYQAAQEAKEKAMGASEKASQKAGEAKEAAKEAEAAEQLSWAKEKAKEGYEAAKSKAEETLEPVKEKIASNLEAAKKKSKEMKDNLGGVGRDEEL